MSYSAPVFGTLAIVAFVFTACTEQAPASSLSKPKATEPGGLIPFTVVDDNVQHDTLLVQVTFDLNGGEFLMVASHIEEDFDGLRLYRYTLSKEGGANIHSVSAPGYDSWTLLPTFFENPNDSDSYILLANMGERNSWGQKVVRMKDQFTDLGFLDVAFPERVEEPDTAYLKLKSIGPYSRCIKDGDGMRFTFQCDSVYLYDDLMGNVDQVVPANWVYYSWSAKEGMILWYKNEARKATELSL